MLDALCERMWDSSVFPVIDISDQSGDHLQMLEQELGEQDNTLIRMKLMENRYHYENELMQAVSLGQIQKFDQLMASFTEISFEQRTSDPVRNMKNYCIIMNTLLRKAAENGGVHPFYIDRVSSSFAFKIEQLSSLADTADIMSDIFSSYCRLVRKHSLKNYSPIVQKTVVYIEADLSANLSLSALANAQNVSAGYLSTVFKRETGMTVTQFVRRKRMNHAMNLLRTTRMQIQTIALHCGIADLQYFSKLFKKHSGKSPKEYRESN